MRPIILSFLVFMILFEYASPFLQYKCIFFYTDLDMYVFICQAIEHKRQSKGIKDVNLTHQ